MKMKLTFYYLNGKRFTATGVVNWDGALSPGMPSVIYEQERKKDGVFVRSEVEVSKEDLIGVSCQYELDGLQVSEVIRMRPNVSHDPHLYQRSPQQLHKLKKTTRSGEHNA